MKPKILVLTTSFPRWENDTNGVFVLDFVKSISTFYEVHIIAPFFVGALKEEIISDIHIHRFVQFPFKKVSLAYGDDIMTKLKNNKLMGFVVPFFILSFLLKALKVIKKEKISLLHAFWLIPQGFIAVIIKKIFFRKLKIIVSILGADINGFNNKAGRFIQLKTLNELDLLIGQSKPMIEKAKKIGYEGLSVFLPLGIDTNSYKPMPYKNNFDFNNPELLFVATLSLRKGISYLIEAISIVKKQVPNVKLKVIGNGDQMNAMKLLTKELDIVDNVEFLGFKSPADLNFYFSSCDLFVLPSLSEGFPLVVISALSSGAVTLVSDLPVFRELKEENNNLLTLFEVKNSDDLSNQILKILKDYSNYSLHTIENRDYIINHFDNNQLAIKYKNLILSLNN